MPDLVNAGCGAHVEEAIHYDCRRNESGTG